MEPQSAYHGDGEPAIAVNVQRGTTGHALDTIAAVASALPGLERDFPGVDFSIPDTQGTLIKLSVGNMLDALRDAVIMTVLVIFLFLADWRGMTLAAVSIPFTYLLTFAVMWLIGYEFDMVTLTAVIIAVGMLLDDAIVVLENIERHYHEDGTDVHEAVVGGTQEVMLAIFSGTYATVMVLLPIIFIGGFVQTVLRPLSMSLVVALLASYIVSVTVIPLLAPLLLRRSAGAGRNRFERVVHLFDQLRGRADPRLLRAAHRAPPSTTARCSSSSGSFCSSSRRRRCRWSGRNLMPPMDTGIVKINFETDSNTSLAATRRHPLADGEDHPLPPRGDVRVLGDRLRARRHLLRRRPPAAAGQHHRSPRGPLPPQGHDLGDRGRAARPLPRTCRAWPAWTSSTSAPRPCPPSARPWT